MPNTVGAMMRAVLAKLVTAQVGEVGEPADHLFVQLVLGIGQHVHSMSMSLSVQP